MFQQRLLVVGGWLLGFATEEIRYNPELTQIRPSRKPDSQFTIRNSRSTTNNHPTLFRISPTAAVWVFRCQSHVTNLRRHGPFLSSHFPNLYFGLFAYENDGPRLPT